MSDVWVHTLFQKDSCKMVKGTMILMKGIQIGSLYKLLGNVDSTGCNNIISSEVDSTGCNNMVASEVISTSTQLNLTQAESIQTDST
jgi:hypothetical protein